MADAAVPGNQLPDPGPAARQRVRIAVVVPAGPGDDVLDTLQSVVRYTDRSRLILVVDDTGALLAPDRLSEVRALSEDIVVIPAPPTPPGLFGRLWVKLAAGYTWILDRCDPGLVLRLDADAVMLGTGLEEQAEKALRNDHAVGLLGSYRIGPDAGLRDFSWPAGQIHREMGLRGVLHPRMRRHIRHYYRLAHANGYTDGEHVLGGAYLHSAAAITAIARQGWLDDARFLEKSRLGEDHLISMLTVAAGFRIADFGGPNDPLALSWRGLPAHPSDLLARGKLVTHSVRSWDGLSEHQVRAIFAAARA
jgi:hypothetical protein